MNLVAIEACMRWKSLEFRASHQRLAYLGNYRSSAQSVHMFLQCLHKPYLHFKDEFLVDLTYSLFVSAVR